MSWRGCTPKNSKTMVVRWMCDRKWTQSFGPFPMSIVTFVSTILWVGKHWLWCNYYNGWGLQITTFVKSKCPWLWLFLVLLGQTRVEERRMKPKKAKVSLNFHSNDNLLEFLLMVMHLIYSMSGIIREMLIMLGASIARRQGFGRSSAGPLMHPDKSKVYYCFSFYINGIIAVRTGCLLIHTRLCQETWLII